MNHRFLLLLTIIFAAGVSLFILSQMKSQKHNTTSSTSTDATENFNNPVVESLYVGPVTVPCVGVSPQRCMQVKNSKDSDYTNFYGSIKGFDFVPGYEYLLTVSKETIPNPPADSSAYEYTMISKDQQTPVPFVMIETPKDFENYGAKGQLEVAGIGRGLFEGNVVVEIIDNTNGTKLAQEVTTLKAPDFNTEGNWDLSLNLNAQPNNNVTLMAYSPSPVDPKDNISYSVPLILVEGQPASEFNFNGTAFKLLSLKTEAKSSIDPSIIPVTGSTITLNFEESQVNGSSSCNTYFGGYTATQSGDFKIGPLGSTKKYCSPEQLNQQEYLYLTSLEKTNQWEETSNGIMLFNETEKVYLEFNKELIR